MKKKGHHYITESYQRNFADEKGHIWVLTPEGKIFNTNPENTFKEDHFYTVKFPDGGGTLFVEETLSKIEGKFNAVIKNIISNKQPLDKENRAYVSMFAAGMMNRTKLQRNHLRKFFERMIGKGNKMRKFINDNQTSAAAIPSQGEGVSLEELEKGMENFDSHQAKSTISTIQNTGPIIFEMKWKIMEAPPGTSFLLSDNPLGMCSPVREHKYGTNAIGAAAGLAHQDVEVTLPLSKKFALVCMWDTEEEYFTGTERQVDQINYRTLRSAKNVIADNSKVLEEIIEKDKKARGII